VRGGIDGGLLLVLLVVLVEPYGRSNLTVEFVVTWYAATHTPRLFSRVKPTHVYSSTTMPLTHVLMTGFAITASRDI